MRLWSIHPSYLDRQGLIASWREGLLAKKVLEGNTKGYTSHPQLNRFKQTPDPEAAINAFLGALAEEAMRRGYNFDVGKLQPYSPMFSIEISDGQLAYEMQHLIKKLQIRDPAWFATLEINDPIKPHPIFTVVPGGVANWEVTKL